MRTFVLAPVQSCIARQDGGYIVTVTVRGARLGLSSPTPYEPGVQVRLDRSLGRFRLAG